MDINDRISNLISILDSNPNSFSDSIGVKSPIIYNIVKGRRSKPSYEVLQKILTAYNAINANWLLKGEGEIWKSSEDNLQEIATPYLTIEDRISYLVSDLRAELGDNASLGELTELVKILIKENLSQKGKISALYDKQEKILAVIKEKIGLDL